MAQGLDEFESLTSQEIDTERMFESAAQSFRIIERWTGAR